MSEPEGSWRRGFWSLIVTQSQGAFSDNALKNLVVFMLIGAAVSERERHTAGEAIGALFSAPFILFSMAGGFLADRFSKRSVTIAIKVFEIAVMMVALAGLAWTSKPLLLAAVFLMGTHSAFFGPSKYGLLPELLPEKKLSWGNGVLELGTFVAIIMGTVAGGYLSETFRGQQHVSGFLLIGLAVAGLAISQGVTRVPPADPTRRFTWTSAINLAGPTRTILRNRPLKLAVVGNTYFWFMGALLQLNIFYYGLDVLKLREIQIGYLLVALALGIGLGSMASGILSGNKIETGLIPLGAIGLVLFSIPLAASSISFAAAAWWLALLGFAGGVFAVPINALIQHLPNKEEKGGVLAAANWFSFVGIFIASGMHLVLTRSGIQPGGIFLASSLMTAIATAYCVWLLPSSLLRLLLFLITNTVYRIHVEGRDNVPEKGGALFVCNHLSFVDALLVLASIDRPIRFLMFKDFYDHPLVHPFAKIMEAIPISASLRPRDMIRSLRTASDAIAAGEVVCIFAEGQITRIGQLLPFRRGFERIMKDIDAPIVPVCLSEVWGSIFSFERGRFVLKIPHRIPYKLTLSFGRPMPGTSTAFEVRQSVQELLSDAYLHRRQKMKMLHRAWLRTARRYPLRVAMTDMRSPNVRFGKALVQTVFLARRLRKVWAGQNMVGILMPPSVPGALLNYAALLMGKIPVNLNYTASDAVLASCAKQCGLETVITSQAFLEKVKLTVPGRAVMLEELAAKPSAGERLAALLMAVTLPAALLERAVGRERKGDLEDLATVIFSSGSTGDPKGVMLTHYNIGANIEQVGQVFSLTSRDRLLGILPFFHSFGFTVTLCLPAVLGVGVVYHPNPLDSASIGELVEKNRVTFILATPTFLQAYMRRCRPEQFGSVQFVLAGAEKLSDRVATAFEDVFGIRPFEGYGCTECSPAVTVNTRDYRSTGFRQVGAKRGTIGHPVPGVGIRIVDPDTRQPLPPGQPGLLLVKGPNVMKGYLGRPEKTAEVLQDGWYTTGDIAAVDEDGFLTITDRLSRFSKIGGEMVPHIRVEDRLHEMAGLTEQAFTVVGVPDPKKGERLVVLHTLADEPLKECLEKLAQSDLPNLWKPGKNQFFRVEALPYLGTGKLDLRKMKDLAVQLSTADERG